MKSEPRKRAARNKTGATDKDLAATNVNEADNDYARQLLADAEAMLSGDDGVSQASNAGVNANMNSRSTKVASAKANEVVSESTKQSSVNETIAATVVLPAQCLMRDAVELKSRLLLQLEAEDTVQIDVSKVERIDASVMQVLLAFVRDRTQRKQQVEWRGTNEVIMEAARILGLHSVLHLPVTEAA